MHIRAANLYLVKRVHGQQNNPGDIQSFDYFPSNGRLP